VFLTAVAQHTSTMRVGHGVVLLPKPYNHAVRVAERAAALDILSNGRLDVGTGRSATTLELRAFEIDPDDTRPMWEEAIQIIPKLWTEERTSFQGKYYNLPKRTVLPRPHQKPHPPLWMAGGQQSSLELAAKYGLGFLHFALLDPEESFNYVRSYKTLIQHAQPPAGFTNNQFGAFTIGFCGEDEDEVRTVGGPGALYYASERTRVQGAWERAYGTVPESYRHYQNQTAKIDLTAKDALPGLLNIGSMAVGTPEQCRKVVEIYEQAGADQLILYMELPFLNHEQISKSIRLFGEQVIQPYRAAQQRAGATGNRALV
jgi:alkanesulfonate monooxygenase SsuD/methylene tetrahydromethanopterin reductase-like flavin-dependent oxidoreductase (luciferase family)